MAKRKTVLEALAIIGSAMPAFANWLAQPPVHIPEGSDEKTNLTQATTVWHRVLAHRSDEVVFAAVEALLAVRTSRDGPYVQVGDLVAQCDAIELAGRTSADEAWAKVMSERKRIAALIGWEDRRVHLPVETWEALEACGGFGAVLHSEAPEILAATFRRAFDAREKRIRDHVRLPMAVQSLMAKAALPALPNAPSREVQVAALTGGDR